MSFATDNDNTQSDPQGGQDGPFNFPTQEGLWPEEVPFPFPTIDAALEYLREQENAGVDLEALLLQAGEEGAREQRAQEEDSVRAAAQELEARLAWVQQGDVLSPRRRGAEPLDRIAAQRGNGTGPFGWDAWGDLVLQTLGAGPGPLLDVPDFHASAPAVPELLGSPEPAVPELTVTAPDALADALSPLATDALSPPATTLAGTPSPSPSPRPLRAPTPDIGPFSRGASPLFSPPSSPSPAPRRLRAPTPDIGPPSVPAPLGLALPAPVAARPVLRFRMPHAVPRGLVISPHEAYEDDEPHVILFAEGRTAHWAPAHFNAAPGCSCLACKVERAVGDDGASAHESSLRQARTTHSVLLRTGPDGVTHWRPFIDRYSGNEVHTDWRAYPSGLPVHDPVVLE